ncbi:MAG: hypothetical protein R3C19_05850 [Planctomycetaceae bacterium]
MGGETVTMTHSEQLRADAAAALISPTAVSRISLADRSELSLPDRRVSQMSSVVLLFAIAFVPVSVQAALETESPVSDETAEVAAETPEELLPIRQRPYQVTVSMAFSGDSRLAVLNREHVLKATADAVRRMYGPMWNASFEINTWLQPGTPDQLKRLQLTDLIREAPEPGNSLVRYPETEVHKAFLVTVSAIQNSYTVACREYDSRSQELTPIRTDITFDERSIPAVAARLIRDSFRPTLMFFRRFQDADGNEFVELEVQAGEFPAPDPSAEQIVIDDVLRPFLREMDRRDPSKLKALKALPLTYIRVTGVDNEIARGMVTGVLISHASLVPFGGRARRTEQMALRQRPAAGSSRVKIVLRTRPDRPLVSQRTALAFKLRYTDQDQAEQVRLLSDRNGEVEIFRHPEFPTFWIYVYSGGILLARVPYAPGMLPTDVIELPDDSIRLSLEGELQLLQDELVDAVALREVYFSMASKAAEAGNAVEMERHLKALAEIPGREYFLEQLSLRRVPALNEAREKRNRSQERDVTRLCNKMQDSLTRFFSDEKKQERLEQIAELRAKAGR